MTLYFNRAICQVSQQFAGTHLYTWVERGTVRVKCLVQEHNTMSPAWARTRTARPGVERTNHEATASPTVHTEVSSYIFHEKVARKIFEIIFPIGHFTVVFLVTWP